MVSACHSLNDYLRAQADSSGGVLPFVRFMAHALYHPQWGYYISGRPKLGRGGDFVTAPEMTAMFGELIAVQIVEVWEIMGCPDSFTVVEMGGGSGKLAWDVLGVLQRIQPLYDALSFVLIETSPDFQNQQRNRLSEDPKRLSVCVWETDITACDSFEGVIYSNEFLDALPVHWVEMTESGLQERAVVWQDERWDFTCIPPELPLSADYFDHLNCALSVGFQTEVGLAGQQWMALAANQLNRGLILSIDYGYCAKDYYALPQGTLMGHRGHQTVNNPLETPGEMDLTAHVDFSAIARSGVQQGLTTIGWTTQAWFLMGLGLLERMDAVMRSATIPESDREHVRQTVMRLTMPDGMGERFKVLAQGRGLPEGAVLTGFRLNDQQKRL
ncbi:MAG: SAM-dependent methyltransferase [Magnetococcales bacterium]|nr:SAM-dependent methyltransferase [Magnetococcales bacterium]